MKASHKNAQNDTYQSRPLAPEQLNAITYLCTGMTDAEVAAAVGCQRETIWCWRNTSPDFISELEKARQQFMSGAVDKLRSALPKAVQNVVDAINTGDLKASLALLKVVGFDQGRTFSARGDRPCRHWPVHLPAATGEREDPREEFRPDRHRQKPAV
jgi:hypothetical protein